MLNTKDLEDQLEELKKRVWALSKNSSAESLLPTIRQLVSSSVNSATQTMQTSLSQSISQQISQEQSTLSQSISTQISQAQQTLSQTISSQIDALSEELSNEIEDQLSQIQGGSFPYVKLASVITNTSTSSGETTLNIADIIGASYVSGAVYELYGYILCYHTDTRFVYLYTDLWGDSSTYYLLNNTGASRVGSTAFSVPCSSTFTFKKNNSVSEFKLRIYGYRRIS